MPQTTETSVPENDPTGEANYDTDRSHPNWTREVPSMAQQGNMHHEETRGFLGRKMGPALFFILGGITGVVAKDQIKVAFRALLRGGVLLSMDAKKKLMEIKEDIEDLTAEAASERGSNSKETDKRK